MVSFGNASGAVPPVAPITLMAKGSLFLTRPTVVDYLAERRDLVDGASELFDVVRSGAVRIRVARTHALADAAEAHRARSSPWAPLGGSVRAMAASEVVHGATSVSGPGPGQGGVGHRRGGSGREIVCQA